MIIFILCGLSGLAAIICFSVLAIRIVSKMEDEILGLNDDE